MKEFIFNVITGFAALAFLLSALMLNFESWTSTYICGISLLWLTYAVYKSEQKHAEKDGEEE